jgi:hypothetical protein
LHIAEDPVRTFIVQAFMSSHVAGQFPSQVSPASTTPLPQTGAQSVSFVALQPGAQQPSPPAHAVIGGYEHVTLHCAAFPVRTFVVHAFMSLQVAGQFPSHVSPDSTAPFPHIAEQFASLFALQLAGQHPSLPLHAVINVNVHWTLH